MTSLIPSKVSMNSGRGGNRIASQPDYVVYKDKPMHIDIITASLWENMLYVYANNIEADQDQHVQRFVLFTAHWIIKYTLVLY